jgi:hypothetical protein
MIQQIKHENGHAQFRAVKNLQTGQNSLHLSGSTPAPTLRAMAFDPFVAAGTVR